MLKNNAAENEKLKGLNKQMGDMHDDFEDMKRTREEAKKQMEAKFLDIYKKIQSMKDAIDSEAKRVNDSLIAFSAKFDNQLNSLKETIYNSLNEEKEYNKKMFDMNDQRMNSLENMIKMEREDRMRQNDEQLSLIRNQIASLQKDSENEKAERLQHEKEIYRGISDNVFDLNERIQRERDDRNTKMTLMKESNSNDFKQRDKYFSDFQNKMKNELGVLKDEIYFEMDNRFSHQNEIVDNISNFLKTFQDTLKVVGKDS